MSRKRLKKGQFLELAEFVPAYAAFRLGQALPLRAGHLLSQVLGHALYYLAPKRRHIALDNLRNVFGREKSEREIKDLARRSCYSFLASLFETAKFLSYLKDPENGEIRDARTGLESLFHKAKEIHERARGCIFVTPHFGNWEFLPYIASSIGIPLVLVVRPLDNRYLEKWLYQYRAASGQVVIPKTNSVHLLQRALRQGKSIGMLPDQSTMKAITVEYMGRKATVTPIPALLAVLYNRPIVVVACCRLLMDFRFDGFVSDPIWPVTGGNEKDEIFRLTRAMNQEIEKIVYQYPEQYFWMHDRWKRYSSTRELLGG
ncbi:MAG: lysophospholipid acyltransferase family protein [Candidatus Binatia bacterium]